MKNLGPIHYCEPPHAHSPGVASGTVARCLRIEVHDANDNDNAWQRGPLWPHGMGAKIKNEECIAYRFVQHMYNTNFRYHIASLSEDRIILPITHAPDPQMGYIYIYIFVYTYICNMQPKTYRWRDGTSRGNSWRTLSTVPCLAPNGMSLTTASTLPSGNDKTRHNTSADSRPLVKIS